MGLEGEDLRRWFGWQRGTVALSPMIDLRSAEDWPETDARGGRVVCNCMDRVCLRRVYLWLFVHSVGLFVWSLSLERREDPEGWRI